MIILFWISEVIRGSELDKREKEWSLIMTKATSVRPVAIFRHCKSHSFLLRSTVAWSLCWLVYTYRHIRCILPRCTTSISLLESTQLLDQRESRALFPQWKRPGRRTDGLPPRSVKIVTTFNCFRKIERIPIPDWFDVHFNLLRVSQPSPPPPPPRPPAATTATATIIYITNFLISTRTK